MDFLNPVRAEHAFPPTTGGLDAAAESRQLSRILALSGDPREARERQNVGRLRRPAALRAAKPRFARHGLALQVVELCRVLIRGEAKLQADRFVVLGNSRRSNHYIRSAWEFLALKPLYSSCLGALGAQTIVFVVSGSHLRSNQCIRSVWESKHLGCP